MPGKKLIMALSYANTQGRFFKGMAEELAGSTAFLWIHFIIGVSLIALGGTGIYVIFKIGEISFRGIYLSFVALIIGCGLWFLLEIAALWFEGRIIVHYVHEGLFLLAVGMVFGLRTMARKALAHASATRSANMHGIQLETIYQELEEIHRIKTEFLVNLGEDLRRRLPGIQESVQTLLVDERRSESERRELHQIQSNAELIRKHCENILKFCEMKA